MSLKILGRMVLYIIRIIAHNPYENNSIIMTKNHHPSKGKKGHSKEAFEGQVTNQRVSAMIIPSRSIQSKKIPPPIDSMDQKEYMQVQPSTIILKASMID